MSTILADFETLREAVNRVVKLVNFPGFGSAAPAVRIRTEEGQLVVSANSPFAQVRATVPAEIDDEIGWDVLIGFPPLLAMPVLGRVEVVPSGTTLRVRAGKSNLGARMITGDPTDVADPQLPPDLIWRGLPPAIAKIAKYGGEAHPYLALLPTGFHTFNGAALAGFVPLDANDLPMVKIPNQIENCVGMQFAIAEPTSICCRGDGIEMRASLIAGAPIDCRIVFTKPAIARLKTSRDTLRQWAAYTNQYAGMDYPKVRLACEPDGLGLSFKAQEAEADHLLPATTEVYCENVAGTYPPAELLTMLAGTPTEVAVEFVPRSGDPFFNLRIVCDDFQSVTMPIGE